MDGALPTLLTFCPHLSLETGDSTMTSLGLPVAALDVRYHTDLHHRHPVPVGEKGRDTAYPVFPTWGFVHLEWSQATILARLLVRAARIPQGSVSTLPAEHLLTRLLFASFPIDVLTDGNYRASYWMHHVDNIFDKNVPNDRLCTQPVLLERQEAADLASTLWIHILSATLGSGEPHPLDGLLALLVEAAAPPVLFRRSSHDRMEHGALCEAILDDGRDALPPALTIPGSPFGKLPL